MHLYLTDSAKNTCLLLGSRIHYMLHSNYFINRDLIWIPQVIFLNMGYSPCERSALWVLFISRISYHSKRKWCKLKLIRSTVSHLPLPLDTDLKFERLVSELTSVICHTGGIKGGSKKYWLQLNWAPNQQESHWTTESTAIFLHSNFSLNKII